MLANIIISSISSTLNFIHFFFLQSIEFPLYLTWSKTKQKSIIQKITFLLVICTRFSIPPTSTKTNPTKKSYPYSVELQKANLQANDQTTPNANGGNPTTSSTTSPSSSSSCSSTTTNTTNTTNTNTITTNTLNNPLASAIPLAQLLTKPGALNALQSLTALSSLTDILGGLANLTAGPPIQTTGVHRNKHLASRVRTTNTASVEKKGDRNKFNPY